MTVFLGHGSTPCVGRGRIVGSAGRHTDLRRPLALPGAAVSHGVLPAMAWEGPGSRPRGTAPRTTNATVPLWRKNARAEGREVCRGWTRRGSTVVHGRLLPISERAFVAAVCYGGRAAGGCRGETAVWLDA